MPSRLVRYASYSRRNVCSSMIWPWLPDGFAFSAGFARSAGCVLSAGCDRSGASGIDSSATAAAIVHQPAAPATGPQARESRKARLLRTAGHSGATMLYTQVSRRLPSGMT